MNMASSSIVIFFFLVASVLLVPSLASEEWVAGESNSGTENTSLCSSGMSQSPIDIITAEAFTNKSLEPLTRNYHVFNASLLRDDKHLQVVFNVTGGLIIDGKVYNLKQMHRHTPSEHRFDGIQCATELHQVHLADDGNVTVIGILLKEGPPSLALTMLKPQLDELAKKPCEGAEERVAITTFAPSILRRRPRNYYRYMGSLTTPPCAERVLWNVLAKVKTISNDQVALLKAAICGANKENARPTQSLNGRTVQKYDEELI